MALRNPCKRCLVRPTCNSICEPMKDYTNIYYNMACTLMILFVAIIHIGIVLWSHFQFHNYTQYSILISSLAAGYIWVGYYIYTDWNGFKDLKYYEKIVSTLFGPWLIPGIYLYQKLDDRDIIDLQLFKYNYKIRPHLLQRMNEGEIEC